MNEPLTTKHCGACGAVEERLAHLERGLKLGKRGAAMVLLVLLVAWSFATRSGWARAANSGAKDLVARSLTIVDEKGNQRVVLAVTDGARVVLYEKGNARVGLGVSKDGPGMALVDENGHPSVVLAVTKNRSGVVLHDEKGNQRVGLGVSKNASTVLLGDERGNLRVALTVAKDGPSVALDDDKGHNIWREPR